MEEQKKIGIIDPETNTVKVISEEEAKEIISKSRSEGMTQETIKVATIGMGTENKFNETIIPSIIKNENSVVALASNEPLKRNIENAQVINNTTTHNPKSMYELNKMKRLARALKKRSAVTAVDAANMKARRKKDKRKRYLDRKNKIKQGNLKHEMEMKKCQTM